MMAYVEEHLAAHWDEIIALRQALHQNPELPYEEQETARLLKTALQRRQIPYREGLCGTGLAALVQGAQAGRTIALRCEMDGLPLQEETGADFASLKQNRMHACGHDAHMAMVLGTALVLNDLRRQLRGAVKFIFQPAEEQLVQGGAKAMIAQGVLRDPLVDAIFGMHVWPDLPRGRFGLPQGAAMASCDTFTITITGKSGHISAPHKARNPIFAAAQLINAVAGIKAQKIDAAEKVVLEISSIQGGLTNNVIPDTVTLLGSARMYNHALREQIKQDLSQALQGICAAFGMSYTLDYVLGYGPVINDDKARAQLCQAAEKVLGAGRVAAAPAVMSSEDIGAFFQEIPGALGLLGVGDGSSIPLHNSRFLVAEEDIRTGIRIFCQLAAACR